MSAPYRDPARLIDEMLTRLEQEQRARHNGLRSTTDAGRLDAWRKLAEGR